MPDNELLALLADWLDGQKWSDVFPDLKPEHEKYMHRHTVLGLLKAQLLAEKKTRDASPIREASRLSFSSIPNLQR